MCHYVKKSRNYRDVKWGYIQRKKSVIFTSCTKHIASLFLLQEYFVTSVYSAQKLMFCLTIIRILQNKRNLFEVEARRPATVGLRGMGTSTDE